MVLSLLAAEKVQLRLHCRLQPGLCDRDPQVSWGCSSALPVGKLPSLSLRRLPLAGWEPPLQAGSPKDHHGLGHAAAPPPCPAPVPAPLARPSSIRKQQPGRPCSPDTSPGPLLALDSCSSIFSERDLLSSHPGLKTLAPFSQGLGLIMGPSKGGHRSPRRDWSVEKQSHLPPDPHQVGGTQSPVGSVSSPVKSLAPSTLPRPSSPALNIKSGAEIGFHSPEVTPKPFISMGLNQSFFPFSPTQL